MHSTQTALTGVAQYNYGSSSLGWALFNWVGGHLHWFPAMRDRVFFFWMESPTGLSLWFYCHLGICLMTDTMGSSMASSTRLGSSYIFLPAYRLLTWGYGKPEDGKGPPQISLSYFHQLRRKPKGHFPLTKPAQLKDMGGFPYSTRTFPDGRKGPPH